MSIMRGPRRPWLPAVALFLAACSPTFNWREVRPEGGGVQALMPCKPETAERAVPLGPSPTELHMSSCRAGGLTYALAWARVPSPQDAAAALAGWEAASRQGLRATADAEALVPPVRGAGRAHARALSGLDGQGQPVEARVVYAVQGERLFQAAVYGRPLPDEHVNPFLASLEIYP